MPGRAARRQADFVIAIGQAVTGGSGPANGGAKSGTSGEPIPVTIDL